MRPHLTKFVLSLFASWLALAALSYGQSLGDIAREQRLKKQNQTPQTAPKVITNDDISSHGDGDADSGPAAPHEEPPAHKTSKTAEQWKAEIANQRSKVAALQSQIDKLNASIHFAYGNCVYHCAEYNEMQLKKQDQVKTLQGQLDDAKATLDELQEGARQDGFGDAVYEP